MKTILKSILCFGLLLLGIPAEMNADIVINIKVTDPTQSKAVIVYQTTIDEIPLDEQGCGSKTYTNINAMYANFFYGMESKKIFFEDGDRINITFNGKDFLNTMRFEVQGGKEKIFNYLNQVKLPSVTDDKYALPFDQYLKLLEDKENQALKLLKAWKLDELNSCFTAMEKGRIKYTYASGSMMYAVGHPLMAKDSTYRPDEAYYNTIRQNFVENEDWLDIKEYREYMKETANILGCGNKDIKSIYEKTLCQMNYLADNLQNDKVRQTLLNVLAIEQVEQYGTQNIDDLLSIYNTYVSDSTLRFMFKEKCDAWDLVRKGKLSPDFKACDLNGKIYTLADFKGKYVYIDLWATWCGPCRREAPFFQKLIKEYEGKNITFISLSTDAKKSDWINMLSKQKMSGVQLYLGAGSDFQKAYRADGIPHFILLNPEGIIISNNMLRPSSEDIRNYLNKLLDLK